MRPYMGIMFITGPLVVALQVGLHYLLFRLGMPPLIKYTYFNVISLAAAVLIGSRQRSIAAGVALLAGSFLTQLLLVVAFWIYMAVFIGGT